MMKIVKVAYNTLIWIVILTSLAISREGPLRSISQRLDERTNIQGPTKSLVNINHFDIWVRRDGFFPWDGTYTGTAGAYPAPPPALVQSLQKVFYGVPRCPMEEM